MFLDWLIGCSHKKLTFPQKPKRKGTYRVCVDCGKEFCYDWQAMKIVPWPKEEPVKQQQINPALEIQRGDARIR